MEAMSDGGTSIDFRGRVLLAPLTKGGNAPFRRLVRELGADVTCGEMALARHLDRGRRGELALIRRAEGEACFGAQLAGRHPGELARATEIAVRHGADFVDLNLGCPIDLFCRRGLGAALLRKPGRVEKIVRAMVDATDRPVTVKFRLGYEDHKPRYRQIAAAAAEGGASAITLHGRSRTQRYKRAARWDAVAELVESFDLPVIGNGDILTFQDARFHQRESGCASVMIGRGALIKPWIFREIAEGRDYLLSAEERLDILRRYRELAFDHFGRDDHGRRRVLDFLTFHLDFYHRYRPEPSRDPDPDDHPLIQTRQEEIRVEDGTLAERLYDGRQETWAEIARALVAEVDEDPDRSLHWREHSAATVLDSHALRRDR